MDKKCSTCKYNQREKREVNLSLNWRAKNGRFVCTNENSNKYGIATGYSDVCEKWEGKI